MSKLIELLKKGLEANPGDWNIRKGLVEQYVQTGDYDELTAVIETAPGIGVWIRLPFSRRSTSYW